MANQTKQARRDRQGRAVAASGGMPRIVAGARKRAAQETAGTVAGDRRWSASPPRRSG